MTPAHSVSLGGDRFAVHTHGSGLPLVLLHAFPLDHEMWESQEPLGEAARLIVPDQRGFGGSGTARPIASIAEMADDVAAVLDLDLRTASLGDVDRELEAFQSHYGKGQAKRRMMQVCGYRGLELVRASELPAPLPLGHFLRQFGQSDRETIEGGRTVATIPQILAMFNGPITHAMLEQGSVIYDEVTSHAPREAIDVVFLAVLSRRPSADDRALAIKEIMSADDKATGCGNLIWALLNTREFIFIQ